MTLEALRVGDEVVSRYWGAGQPRIQGRIVRIDRKVGEAEVHLLGTDPPVIRRRSLRNLRKEDQK